MTGMIVIKYTYSHDVFSGSVSVTDDSNTEQQKPQDKQDQYRRTYEGLIEERIAQAISDGLFDNLPGQGRPQRLDDDALVPEDERAGFRLLKASGFAPPWIEARNEIDEERARLAAWLADVNRRWPSMAEQRRAKVRAEYRQKLHDLQRAILHFNLRAPAGIAHIGGLQMDEELRKLGAA
jgi:hypothetical protein